MAPATLPIEFIATTAEDGTPLTFAAVKSALAKQGINIKRTGYSGELRVAYAASECFRRGITSEPSAYYTDDLFDAYATGLIMAKPMECAA